MPSKRQDAWLEAAKQGLITQDKADYIIQRGNVLSWAFPPTIHFDLAGTFWGDHEEEVRQLLNIMHQHDRKLVAVTNDFESENEILKEIRQTGALPEESFSLLYKFKLSSYGFFDVEANLKVETLIDDNPAFITERRYNLMEQIYHCHLRPNELQKAPS